MRLPALRMPQLVDMDDVRILGIVGLYSLLVLWIAMVCGLAVHLFLWVAFG